LAQSMLLNFRKICQDQSNHKQILDMAYGMF
jgi:hypothetical protein